MADESFPLDEHIAEIVGSRFAALRTEIDAQGEGAAPDTYMKAFYQRCGTELDTNPWFSDAVVEYITKHPTDTPIYGANKLFRAVQYEVIPIAKPDYPAGGENGFRDPNFPRGRHVPSGWDDAFEAIQTPFGRIMFKLNLIQNHIQSNIAYRGSVLRVVPQLYGMKKIKGYSGGTSVGYVETLMATFDDVNFKYPVVKVGTRNPERLLGFEHSRHLSHQFGQLLRNREFSLNHSLGVDLMPPKFTAAIDWARSCSYRPSEFLRPELRTLEQKLLSTEVPQIEYHQGNFAHPLHVHNVRDQHPRWRKSHFDMAFFSTSLYQCTEEERDQAFDNVYELTAKNGIIAVLDFAHKGEDGRLHFVPNWRDWDYNLHVFDKANESAGWQHIFGIREGRVREVVLGHDLGRLAFNAMREAA